jgi:dolichol-phosphate mannosyltransferase
LAPGPQLTIVVPTRNEHDNVDLVYDALCRVLHDINWEAIVIDDDSTDGTAEAACQLAKSDRRVRCIRRIGRRGLASACVEGILASSAPYIAVMDADLQHDEHLLPRMLEILIVEPHVDAVVGSCYVEQYRLQLEPGTLFLKQIGHAHRSLGATGSAHRPDERLLHGSRETFERSVRRLSSIGFKLDIVASSPRPLLVKEIPYHFRERHSGESKLH